MKVINKIALQLEGFEHDVETHLKNEVSLGRLYDYSCALLGFVVQKMNEAKETQIKSPEIPADQPKEELTEIPKAE